MKGRGRRQGWNSRRRQEINFRSLRRLDPREYLLKSADSGISIVGSAPKDLLFMGGREDWSQAYIAKGPHRVSARECVTEEIISAVGRMLPLRLAESRVVLLGRHASGDADIRFLSRYFLRRSEEQLVHGAELVAAYLQSDPLEVEETFGTGSLEEQSLYTVDALLDVLREQCRKGEYELVRDGFGRMMAFDAIVGANDRHAMNWGVIRNAIRSEPLRFAPVFDTARGLFWDHTDQKLRALAERGEQSHYVQRYAMRSKPLIGCSGGKPSVPSNHFDVIARTMDQHWNDFRKSIPLVIRSFDPAATMSMLQRDFGRVVGPLRLAYIGELLRFRHQTLLRILE